MNLIIDIGNTRIKAAVFNGNKISEKFIFNSTIEFFNANIFSLYKINNCIIGSVVNEIEDFILLLQKFTTVILFTSETKVTIKNLYQTKNTLGSDRLAASVGGNFLFPGKNILIIDSGTCTKYNFINKNNEYIGGAISPGLKMRLKSMHNYTSKLPLIELKNEIHLTGKNTEESLLSGVVKGLCFEIEGFVSAYEKKTDNMLQTLITGGDAAFLVKQLKTCNFAHQILHEPDLVLYGLHNILLQNI